jgi:hypothetical protein
VYQLIMLRAIAAENSSPHTVSKEEDNKNAFKMY